MLLQLIVNALMSAAGIAILAGHFQPQILHNLIKVLARVIGLGITIFHWANNPEPITKGASGVIFGAAEGSPLEEVPAFCTPKVRQHVTRVQLFLGLTAAFLAAPFPRRA